MSDPWIRNYLAGQSIAHMSEDLKLKRQQRAQQAQEFQQHLEDRAQARKMSDFQGQMALNSMGFTQPEAGASTANDEQLHQALSGFGANRPEIARPLTETPWGTRRAPSQMEQMNQMSAAGRAAGNAAVYKSNAQTAADRQSGKTIRMKFPAIGDNPAQDLWVPAEHYGAMADQINKLQQGVKSGAILNGQTTVDANGDRMFTGIDATTRQPIEIKFPTQVAPKAGPKEDLMPTSNEISAEADSFLPNIYNYEEVTPEVINQSKGIFSAPEGSPGYVAPRDRVAKQKEALARVQHAKDTSQTKGEASLKAKIHNKGVMNRQAPKQASGGQKISRTDPRYMAAVQKYGQAKADEYLQSKGVVLE